MALLSIIIPIYNASKYLRQTLDSILCQGGADMCEIMLINDGSKDSSLDIMLEYSQRHLNIRVIDKANEGVSATRNRGIEEASGEYIYFMDADDILHPKAINLILSELDSNRPDILTWQFKSFYRKPKFISDVDEIDVTTLSVSSQEAFNYLMQSGFAVSLWNKAIRRSLIGDVIRFDPTMTYGEDMFFSWKAILLSNNIRYIAAPLYYYRQTGDSAVSRYHANLYDKYKHAFDDMVSFAKQQGLWSESLKTDITYHFACRIPALTSMISRAPMPSADKIRELQKVLDDEMVADALLHDKRLSGAIYRLARNRPLDKMLLNARMFQIKSRILFPIKFLLK